MKLNLKKRTGIALFIFAYLNILGIISAANIGISPASISFEKVLRDGYAEKSVVISVDTSEPVDIEIQPRGEIANWLNFSNTNFTVSKDKPHILKISVTPPVDIPNGDYSGYLRIKTSGFGKGLEGHAVGIIQSSLDLLINVEVTDIEIIECSASNFKVESAEEGDDIIFNVNIANNGNIRLKPKITIDIWDQDQISILKSNTFLEKEILPTTNENLLLKVESDDLKIGQYWADVLVEECYASQTLTFDILEEGALKAEGVLLGIVVKKIAETGETLPINVRFKNTGEKEVEAQFRGKITYKGKVIQILESEKVKVPIDNINVFNFYFTPKKAGKYVISGRVFYSTKKTFESSTTLDAISKKLNLSYFIFSLIYISLVSLIVYLFYKIRKERKSYLNKLKMLEK